jgi:hypothetical protein
MMRLDELHEVKFAQIDSGGNETADLIAAVSGRRLVILGFVLSAKADMTVQIQDGDGNDLFGKGIHLGPTYGQSTVCAYSPAGLCRAPEGKKIQFVSDALGELGGSFAYVEA